MELSRDSGCTRELVWRVSIVEPCDVSIIRRAVQSVGWVTQFEMGHLHVFTNEDQHRLLFLGHTLRIQIRLNYLTPKRVRWSIANVIFDQLCTAMSSATQCAEVSG